MITINFANINNCTGYAKFANTFPMKLFKFKPNIVAIGEKLFFFFFSATYVHAARNLEHLQVTIC